MPCISGPTIEEINFQKKMENPIFAAKQREKWRKEDIKHEKQYKLRLEKEKLEFEKEMKEKNLENQSFNSFMTVFLCKAMEIIVSNFGYKYVNEDLEWWFKEHKFRDNNKDKSALIQEEITKKMIEFNNKYQIK